MGIRMTLMVCCCCLSGTALAEYPDMVGLWTGNVRTVSSGEQVRGQVARGGALIQRVNLRLTVEYQDEEVFMGISTTGAADAEPTPVWGAIRSAGDQAVFVNADGGRGQIWFASPTRLEYCFANQTPEQMSAHCAVLEKNP